MKGDRAPSPDWTDFNRSDPGLTLLELFGYLAEVLAHYQDRAAAEAQLATRRRYALALGVVSAVLVVCWRCTKASTVEASSSDAKPA